jgi:hypothetical protein
MNINSLHLFLERLCRNGDYGKKMNPSMLENARLLGDRRLAEEALERNLLSCKFIRIYFMKASFPMTRMIDYTFQKPAILKLPELVTCPLTAITTQSPGGADFSV